VDHAARVGVGHSLVDLLEDLLETAQILAQVGVGEKFASVRPGILPRWQNGRLA
jgi:hypothetical protein